MDRFQRNRYYSRPYQSTCGENLAADSRRAMLMAGGNQQENSGCMQNIDSQQNQIREGNSCRLPGNGTESGRNGNGGCLNNGLRGLYPTMAYVPVQEGIRELYEPEDALRLGTVFPELCKPFCGCGKRGGGR